MRSLLAVAALLLAAPAHADVRITVDPAAPFTEQDLEDAVRVRWFPAPDKDVPIRVGMLGEKLIVVVGDRSETVTLPDRDRAEAARVIAVVVASLVDAGGPPAATLPAAAPPAIVRVAPPLPPGMPTTSTWSFHLGAGFQGLRTGELPHYGLGTMRAGIGRTLTPNLRALLTVGAGLLDPGYGAMREWLVPVRVGVEASSGWLALEVGVQDLVHNPPECGGGLANTYYAHTAVKAFVSLNQRMRAVLEVEGQYKIDSAPNGYDLYCYSAADRVKYGYSTHVGVEWAL